MVLSYMVCESVGAIHESPENERTQRPHPTISIHPLRNPIYRRSHIFFALSTVQQNPTHGLSYTDGERPLRKG